MDEMDRIVKEKQPTRVKKYLRMHLTMLVERRNGVQSFNVHKGGDCQKLQI